MVLGPPGGPQSLKTPKILYRLFTKFAQFFIWIQKYFNNIVLKKERSYGPLGGPLNLKNPKDLYRLLVNFGTISFQIQECFLIIKNRQTENVPRAPGVSKIWILQKFFRNCFQNLPQRFIRIQELLEKKKIKKKKERNH